MSTTDLDLMVLDALREMATYLVERQWMGRERELVNLFVFAHLLPRIGEGKVIYDPCQIGIEVAVPQLQSKSDKQRKTVVNKDLVIWPSPRMTCWRYSEAAMDYPLSILEWKSINTSETARRKQEKLKEHGDDIEWLLGVSLLVREFTGFAVLVDLQRFSVLSARIKSGTVYPDWFRYDSTA